MEENIIFNKKKILFVLLMLCVALTAISQVSAEDVDNNATLLTDEIITQDMSEDSLQAVDDEKQADEILSDDVEGIEYQSFDVIQNKINNAKDGDTVHISGYFKGSGNQIVIDKSITLEGDDPYTYIKAEGLSRIFYVSSSKVVLKNLVLKDGDPGNNNGGAVYCDINWGASCLLYNCLIGYCSANYGGASYYCDVYNTTFMYNSANRGGAMYGGNVANSAFVNNTASDRGGAIYARDGVSIEVCGFENNTAEYGGAIYSCADYNTVKNCYFESNYASDDGGAIYNNDEYYSGLTVLNSEFWYNEADDDGGAIYTSSSADTTVRDSYFRSNKAGYWGGAMCDGVAYSSQFYLNKADRKGGGMYNGKAFDCAFTWNTPNDTYGTDAYVSIKGQITLSQSGTYFGDKRVSAKVINSNTGNPVSGAAVHFKFSNGKTATVYTGSNGIATYTLPFNPGTYRVTATLDSDIGGTSASMSNIRITKAPATITPTKLSTKFESSKSFKIKVINSKTKKGIGGVKLLLKVYTGKKAKNVHVTTASNGVASYNPSKLKVGGHKVKVSIASSQVSAKAKTSKITVKKASTAIDKYDALYYYKDVKKGKYYIGVYNKNAGKYIKGVKLKVKVFTGKKSKTYTVKTKKDGFGILKVKGLKVGKHKVQITFKGNKNYKKASAKATIEVSKKIPTRTGYYYMFTSYSYGGWVSGRSLSVFVKDIYGNDLKHKKVTIVGSSGDKTTGYSGEMIRLPSGSTVVIKFAGDKKYMPSTYTINFV